MRRTAMGVVALVLAMAGVGVAAPPAPYGGGRSRVAAVSSPMVQATVVGEKQEADAPLKPAQEKMEGSAKPQAAAGTLVGWLELAGALREAPRSLAWVAPDEAGETLSGVLKQLKTVEEGTDYQGVVLYMDWPELSLSQITAIRDGMRKVRAKGKKVLVFAEAYDLMGYLLASGADLILLQHKGDVDLTGLGMEEMYLAGLLEKVGAKADLLQIGQYKGADESMMRTAPSEAWEQNISALLDDMYGQVIDAIGEGRGMSKVEVESMMKDSWTMRDGEYVKRRVVDRLVDRDLIEVTEVEFGDDFSWDDTMGVAESADPMNVENPFALFRMLFETPAPKPSRATIAVIHANGPIQSGDSTNGDGLFGEDSIGSRTLVEALGEARDDDNIKGVVLQLDSPGGSALASEVIWQAIRELGESNKPVYASVGSIAASGGYYMACAADEVYVTPGSIVGSIGVVGGKIVLGGTYEKLGVNVVRRSRGPMGDMFNSVEPFNAEQRAAVKASMERVYDQFVDRVGIGRGSRLKDVGSVAEGRIFTGRQAVANGMADRIGTMDDALGAMAEKLSLKEGEYDVIHLPAPVSLGEFLGGMFGADLPVPSLRSGAALGEVGLMAEGLMGPAAWGSARDVLSGMMLLRREPVLTLMPTVIVVK